MSGKGGSWLSTSSSTHNSSLCRELHRHSLRIGDDTPVRRLLNFVPVEIVHRSPHAKAFYPFKRCGLELGGEAWVRQRIRREPSLRTMLYDGLGLHLKKEITLHGVVDPNLAERSF